MVRGTTISPQDCQNQAENHAQTIEAVCWSPHSKISALDYQKLMNAKTQELCWTLLKKSLPPFKIQQIQKMVIPQIQEKSPTPSSFPIPIIDSQTQNQPTVINQTPPLPYGYPLNPMDNDLNFDIDFRSNNPSFLQYNDTSEMSLQNIQQCFDQPIDNDFPPLSI
ncbi:hypothetical protein GPJ56_006550 [Histomonas meleagridis]|uniref:uncharacterized protein n=1 Tax=Histomonas meleagridis TaxID=135588 RepID=UPI00355A6EC6|nr:hypothetical protein GPJ56_006550 [Histomonas meleagridis]KAH0801787.1 hypothetical protein GO595_005468 [Histomonas meleagridis]